jgi:hypothetical protein
MKQDVRGLLTAIAVLAGGKQVPFTGNKKAILQKS